MFNVNKIIFKKAHLVSRFTRSFSYFRKTGSPSHNFFVIKNILKM